MKVALNLVRASFFPLSLSLLGTRIKKIGTIGHFYFGEGYLSNIRELEYSIGSSGTNLNWPSSRDARGSFILFTFAIAPFI
jgi:hypothetical protein